MAEILDVVDLEALRKEVREKYREVAEDPTAEYHFHTGRPHAIRLGYPELSISAPEQVWTRSWRRSGWVVKVG